MIIHPMSRTCHHPNGLVRITHGTWEVENHIVRIVKSSTIESDNLKTNHKLVLDVRLLERVLTTLIFTVKSIPLRCRFTFSQASRDTLYKVVVEAGSISI